MSDKPQIQMILAKDEHDKFRLWACRGEGKGCARNKYRTSKTPCDDCFGPVDENMTIGELHERLRQGDA